MWNRDQVFISDLVQGRTLSLPYECHLSTCSFGTKLVLQFIKLLGKHSNYYISYLENVCNDDDDDDDDEYLPNLKWKMGLCKNIHK